MTHTTAVLADYVLSAATGELTAAAGGAVRDALVDILGAAAAGWGTPAAAALREVAGGLGAPGPARLWWTGACRVPAAAALANSGAASALDLDDGHRGAGGHPGAAVIPAALAAAQAAGTSGAELAAAVAVGYEVGVRIAAARDFARLDTLSTGRWGAYGAAAAAARLQGVSSTVLAQALAVAGVLAPGLSAAGYSRIMGNQVKEGIPWSAFTGLTALELARAGATGPLDILDHPDYYDARAVTAGLGTDPPAVTRIYFKPYACCRWIHAAIDGLLALMHEERIAAGRIRRLRVHTFARALRLNPYPAPPSLEAAQYSVPFCLGVAAAGGAEALLPLTPQWLEHAGAVDLARRVELQVDPGMEARFPAEAGARVEVETDQGRFERTVHHPLGDPANPMGRVRLEAKFRRLASDRIAPDLQDRLLEIVDTLERREAGAFDMVLGPPPDPGAARSA
jgi:2-methylcitrate dehydratase PrpD